MSTFNLKFYDGNPFDNGFSTAISSSFTYTGPATQDGMAEITDNEAGIEGQTLDDDNSGGETATGTFTINGNTSTNVSVDAEAGWLIRDDVTGQEFNVVSMDIEGGPADGAYTLSEVPLVVGRGYTVLQYNSDPNATMGNPVFTYSEFVCFAPDTMILTPQGPRPVQSLRVGDTVSTLDNGPQPLVWTGARTLVFGNEPHRQKPIEIKRGSLGTELPHERLILSPQHRVLLTSDDLRQRIGSDQVLGLAKGLLKRGHVRQMHGKRSVRYYTVMTPRHEILFANDLAVESFYPGKQGMALLSWIERFQISALFPGVLFGPMEAYGPPVREIMDRCEVEKSTTLKGFSISSVEELT